MPTKKKPSASKPPKATKKPQKKATKKAIKQKLSLKKSLKIFQTNSKIVLKNHPWIASKNPPKNPPNASKFKKNYLKKADPKNLAKNPCCFHTIREQQLSTVRLQANGQPTLEFVDKKHVKIDQGLDVLNFSQGNRGENRKKIRITKKK